MVYACAWNDDSGLHNAYMKKVRLDILEDADKVDSLTQQLIAWGYGFEKKAGGCQGWGQHGGRPRGANVCQRVEATQA